MDFVHLETFSCLVRFRNFSRVAKYLGVSQPTVTIRMKALEDYVGVALMIRTGNKVSLTSAGQVFYRQVERSLRILHNGIHSISKKNGDSEKKLSIACTQTAGTYVIPYFIGQFSRMHKHWEISLHIGNTPDIAELILDEIYDLGIITSYYDHPDIERIQLYHDQILLVSHPSHPFVGKETVSIFDLRNEPLISCARGTSMSYRVESLFREIGIKPNIWMELNHSDTVKYMVLEGNGIAFMPWVSVKDEVKKKKLAILPLQVPKPLIRETSIIFKKKQQKLESVREFIKILDQQFDSFAWENDLPISGI